MALDRGLSPPKHHLLSAFPKLKHPPEPGLPRAEAVGWTCSSQRPQESPLPLATKAVLRGQEVALSAPQTGRSPFPRWQSQEQCVQPSSSLPLESEVVLPRHQTFKSPASCWTTPVMARDDSTTRQLEGTAPPLPAAVAPGAGTRPLPPQGKDEQCQAPLTHPSPSHRLKGKAQQSQHRPFFRFAKPTAAVPGAHSPSCHDREAKGDSMRQQRLWQLLPFYSFRARGRSGRCSSAGGSSSVGSSS